MSFKSEDTAATTTEKESVRGRGRSSVVQSVTSSRPLKGRTDLRQQANRSSSGAAVSADQKTQKRRFRKRERRKRNSESESDESDGEGDEALMIGKQTTEQTNKINIQLKFNV